jgi:hypothetical protein
MQHNGWDRALKATADGTGLVGHAGAVLLRKAADQAGLTAWLGGALRKAGQSPVFDRDRAGVDGGGDRAGRGEYERYRGAGASGPGAGDAPSGPTVRRALDLAGTPAMLDRIACARAKARAQVWKLIEDSAAGFPWPGGS